jgi:hypothetical protein
MQHAGARSIGNVSALFANASSAGAFRTTTEIRVHDFFHAMEESANRLQMFPLKHRSYSTLDRFGIAPERRKLD